MMLKGKIQAFRIRLIMLILEKLNLNTFIFYIAFCSFSCLQIVYGISGYKHKIDPVLDFDKLV
ncbi:hypothetical protein EG248_18210 [Acinetobacter baumannii]|nr:hypothetical protein EG248_18210 [Acinetobacter baumannii]